MTAQEFKEKSTKQRLQYLNSAVEEGLTLEEILAKIEMTRVDLTTAGIFFVGNTFRGKPVVDNGFLSSTESKEVK